MHRSTRMFVRGGVIALTLWVILSAVIFGYSIWCFDVLCSLDTLMIVAATIMMPMVYVLQPLGEMLSIIPGACDPEVGGGLCSLDLGLYLGIPASGAMWFLLGGWIAFRCARP